MPDRSVIDETKLLLCSFIYLHDGRSQGRIQCKVAHTLFLTVKLLVVMHISTFIYHILSPSAAASLII